ncbi:MAG: DMT family transporter [Rhodanobacteraceae bacterium]
MFPDRGKPWSAAKNMISGYAMSRTRVSILTALAMIAFAGNSLLCRAALRDTRIDPATFTLVRIVSGALVLWLIVRLRHASPRGNGSWLSAAALFAYATGFSFAYVKLPAGIGALLLFGAVQGSMVGYGLWSGERLGMRQIAGLVLALGGLVGLLLPGLSAPPLPGCALMLLAGLAWGVYSIRGRGAGEPTRTTAENFLKAVPFAMVLGMVAAPWASPDVRGVGYAIASGALASGIGYAVWYGALKGLRATHAATVQLSVPIIAAAGGVVLLGEHLTLRLLFASIGILGGIALVVLDKAETR